MKKTSYGDRLKALRNNLAQIAPDTAWIIQPQNRRYLSGFRADDAQLTESSGSLLINESTPVLITDSRYATEARKEAPDFEVILLKKTLVDSLAEQMDSLRTEKLGFEENHLTWGLHRKLANRFRKLTPVVRLAPLKELVETMRAVKDRTEIKAMEASASLMSQILGQIIESLEPGMTELDIAWQIENLAHDAGAEGLAFPSIVASGPNGALPHAVPTKRKIRSKEPVILDVGIKVDGYCSDMTRTVFLGRPGPKFRQIYKTVRQAQIAAIQEIRPGIKSTDLDSIARQIIKDAGYGDYFGHALGSTEVVKS